MFRSERRGPPHRLCYPLKQLLGRTLFEEDPSPVSVYELRERIVTTCIGASYARSLHLEVKFDGPYQTSQKVGLTNGIVAGNQGFEPITGVCVCGALIRSIGGDSDQRLELVGVEMLVPVLATISKLR